MVAYFHDVYYNTEKDEPVAVLIINKNECFYYSVSFALAEILINRTLKISKTAQPFSSLLHDLLISSQAYIQKIILCDSSTTHSSSKIYVKMKDHYKSYAINSDEAIFLASIFEVPLNIEQKTINFLQPFDSVLEHNLFNKELLQ